MFFANEYLQFFSDLVVAVAPCACRSTPGFLTGPFAEARRIRHRRYERIHFGLQEHLPHITHADRAGKVSRGELKRPMQPPLTSSRGGRLESNTSAPHMTDATSWVAGSRVYGFHKDGIWLVPPPLTTARITRGGL